MDDSLEEFQEYWNYVRSAFRKASDGKKRPGDSFCNKLFGVLKYLLRIHGKEQHKVVEPFTTGERCIRVS